MRLAAATAGELDPSDDTITLGNGAFAYNVDVTGLQSLNGWYDRLGVNTLADWGWHTEPFARGAGAAGATAALRRYNFTYYDTPVDGSGGTRRVPYANSDGNDAAVVDWLNNNPHRLNLGQLGLRWADSAPLEIAASPMPHRRCGCGPASWRATCRWRRGTAGRAATGSR